MNRLLAPIAPFVILLAAAWGITDGLIKVKCAKGQVTAKVGDDLVVHCRFDSQGEPSTITFSWTKVDTMGIVYNYTTSQSGLGEQGPSYRNRAEVFDSEIPEGNVSLRLRNVTLSDSGIYRLCVTSRSQSNETTVVLGVRAVGEQPVIHSHVTEQGLPVLVCESFGWYPEPTVTWENGLGVNLTEYAHTEQTNGTDGIVGVRSTLGLDHGPISNYTCTVMDRYLNEAVSFVFVVLTPKICAKMNGRLTTIYLTQKWSLTRLSTITHPQLVESCLSAVVNYDGWYLSAKILYKCHRMHQTPCTVSSYLEGPSNCNAAITHELQLEDPVVFQESIFFKIHSRNVGVAGRRGCGRFLGSWTGGMATSTLTVSEDNLCCNICLDFFRDPATLPCGHSFCQDCIRKNWDHQHLSPGIYSCPNCRRCFSPRPSLGKNTVLSKIVEDFLQTDPRPGSQTLAAPQDVPCDSCPQDRKLKAVKSCLVCLTSYCEGHLRPHRDSSAFRDHRLTEPVRDLAQRRCHKHRKPLESYCRTDRRCMCWVCALREHGDHEIITVDEEAEYRKKQIMERKTELQRHLQSTGDEIGKWKQNIDSIEEFARRLKGETVSRFTELLCAVEKAQREVIEYIEREARAELNQANSAKKELEQKWTELRQEKVRLEALSKTNDNIYISQEYLTFNEIAENPTSPPSTLGLGAKLGMVERAVARLSTLIKEHFQSAWMKNLENMISTDKEVISSGPSLPVDPQEQRVLPAIKNREDLLKYSCRITFDPNTVQRELSLSDGNQRVTSTYPRSEAYEQCPERFDLCSQVLCRESFSAGQFYWEMELNDGDAMIGVTHKRIRRKGSDNSCILGRNDFSWCVEFWYNNVSAWHKNEETRLQVGRYGRIGLCLNCLAGTLSFYGITDQISLIHQFQAIFTEPMHPAFWIYCDTTLSICPE
ncbi:tripartite motif-containing protein 16-like [Heptranchias perlo]|uniref:tripartite motif-containing protein 16-like n=1 Tax=Heptranchias perlo TaxID=212740 RepID=UPI00355AAE21